MATALLNAAKRLFTNNLKLKILSLAVALCIWSFAAISRETRYDLALPVELRNIPPGYILASPMPREVRFTLAGPSILLDGVRRANVVLILNMRGAGPGKTLFSHLETNLKLPEGIRMTRTSPATIEIELSRKQSNLTEGDQQQ
jgi:hypothetical protein